MKEIPITNSMSIIAQKLSKVYSDGSEVLALNAVDLVIRESEFTAIMGPSGSGKSTLLNLIGTLDRPTKGRILIDGIDIAEFSGDVLADFRRTHLGFIFQLFNLVPTLTSLENVMLPLIPYQRGLGFKLKQRAEELLEAVGLVGRMAHTPGELSGGEQQRVAVARALINNPSVILADEPTGNVDTKQGDEIMELLMKVRDSRNQTTIVVTHSPRVAAFADRVVFLKDGTIVDESDLRSELELENVSQMSRDGS